MAVVREVVAKVAEVVATAEAEEKEVVATAFVGEAVEAREEVEKVEGVATAVAVVPVVGWEVVEMETEAGMVVESTMHPPIERLYATRCCLHRLHRPSWLQTNLPFFSRPGYRKRRYEHIHCTALHLRTGNRPVLCSKPLYSLYHLC